MRLLIISTSTIHGKAYLEYILDEVKDFFSGVEEIVFVPYARPSGVSHDDYTAAAAKAFSKIGIEVKGMHEFDDPVEAIHRAAGTFIGGGNTFLLLKQLWENGLVEALRERVAAGMPYMGTSAGSNVAGQTINTTNDMPIVYPPTFEALGLMPFNVNPHYLDPIPNSTHMGETRETRINEFHTQNEIPVVGIREGSWLRFNDGRVELKGPHSARIFRAGQSPIEHEPGDLKL
ncbi:MAG: dipeptidase PepE [Flavobacteriales bacterium]|nr:dipeptidase PepE [Flavobacteriales bacterium]